MKNRKYLIATLFILAGMGALTVSCEKEKKAPVRKATLIESDALKLGEDDEDPVIQGKVKKKSNLQPIDSAYVETIRYATNATVRASLTDYKGDFIHTVPQDEYYFKVTVPGRTEPYITDTLRVNGNKSVTIIVD